MTEQQSAIIEWVDPHILKPHPLSLQIYGEDGYQDLVASIRELGVLQPLYATPKDIIISGHRRWRAAQIAHRQVPVIRKSYPSKLDEKQAIIELNRNRIKTGRQLYNEGKMVKEIEAERARVRELAGKKIDPVENFPQGKTRDIVAQTIGLGSGKQWDKLEYVAEHTPELLPDIKPDGMSINRAYKRAKKEAVREAQAIEEVSIPEGVFRVIVVDPPWPYKNLASDAEHRARSPYPTMTLDDIKQLTIASADDCILWLWTTNAFMHDALHVLEAWGFEPKTILTWEKDKMGLGDWLRGKTEHCILAIKGKPQVNLTNETTIIHGPLREHSRKPDEFYTLVGSLCPGRKLEMFSRQKREGWERHGNETTFE